MAIFPRGIPFYTGLRKDSDGIWHRSWIDKSYRSRFRFAFDAWWIDRSRQMPRNFEGSIPSEFADKLKLDRKMGSGTIIVPENLQGNDKLITLMEGKGENMNGALVAYIKYDSDFKGGVIANTFNWVGMAPATEEIQAQLLPRTILISLKAGIKKVFWYEFQAMESNPKDAEHYFGIVHRDLSPKPAYFAYKTLAAMRPSGSSDLVAGEKDGVRSFRWKKPDGTVGHALYVTGADRPTTIAVEGNPNKACDYLGKDVKVEIKDGMAEVTLSSGILYLDGPTAIRVVK